MKSSTNSQHLPPGPKGHFLVGILPEYQRNPLGFLSNCTKNYGDIVYLPGLIPSYLLNHPDLIEEMLVKKQQNLVKSQLGSIVKPLLGNGLLMSEGEFWKKQRHLINPAFHHARIATYSQVMVDYTQKMLTTWQDGEIRDIHHDMMNLTLAIAAKTLFGSQVDRDMDTIERAIKITLKQFDTHSTNLLLFLLPDWIPTPDNLRFHNAVKQIDTIIYRLIQEHRASGQETDDLLSMLLNLQAEDGTRMSDKQVRDEVMTFILAGHETTALVLSWAWYLLAKHPEVEAKLITELQTVLAGRTPDLSDLRQLRYTEWVILETMRLYPPVWAIPRTVKNDCEIGGYPVKKGHGLLACQWIVHRDSRWFSDPDTFNPERWDNDFAKSLPTFAYFPFGGGSRICIGKAFAMMEASVVLATIAQNYRFTLVDQQSVEPWASLTLRPQQPIRVCLHKR
ncbi:MAG: cytochrome P450 [Richelia sp. SM1_7_0]|nr:cytochrome P450 [Richelia sp. SM1_7_0]